MAEVYRTTLVSTKGTIQVVNTAHYVVRLGPGGSSDAEDLLTLILGKIQTKYAAVLGTDQVLVKAACTQEQAPSDTSPPDHYEVNLNVPGTRLGIDSFISPALCALARFPTNAAVKGAHGRQFLPPASSSSALGSGATWKSTDPYYVNAVAYAQELKNGVSSGSWWTGGWDANMVVYSPTRRQEGLPNFYFDVINASVDSAQHFLRSRTK